MDFCKRPLLSGADCEMMCAVVWVLLRERFNIGDEATNMYNYCYLKPIGCDHHHSQIIAHK